MTIPRSSPYIMTILDFVTRSGIQYKWLWIDLCICHTTPFPYNYKGKCVSVRTPGCDKQSPYASHLVIVQKKTEEIHLCVDYCKLNSIMVRDAFPLPRIDEALQSIHSSNSFSSFDLAQGRPNWQWGKQHKKTTFRASSMGLYKFTHMPFRLSNAGFSFCCLMEQCLGDQ